MTEVTVEEWVCEEDLGERDPDKVIGGLGGWFSKEDSWDDYYAGLKDEYKPHMLALRDHCRENRIMVCGFDHQGGEGVPVFSDGSYISTSFRSWGDIMAAIWGGAYTDWAWTLPSDERLRELGVLD